MRWKFGSMQTGTRNAAQGSGSSADIGKERNPDGRKPRPDRRSRDSHDLRTADLEEDVLDVFTTTSA
jgi:hypothetical protein